MNCPNCQSTNTEFICRSHVCHVCNYQWLMVNGEPRTVVDPTFVPPKPATTEPQLTPLRDTVKLLAFNQTSKSQQEISRLSAELAAERERVTALEGALQSTIDGYVANGIASKQLLDDLHGLVMVSPWAPQ